MTAVILIQMDYVEILITKMNIINLSGIDHSNSDYFRLSIAMEAGQTSSIRIYTTGGSGVIEYQTNSDYIYSIKRFPCLGKEPRELSNSSASKIGYPRGVSWAPGSSVSSLSNNELIDESDQLSGVLNGYSRAPGLNKIKPLTSKQDLSQNEYELSSLYFPEEYYNEDWFPDFKIQANNINSLDGRMPFVDIKQNDVQKTGLINLISSSQRGGIFTIDIGRDFMNGPARPYSGLNNIDEIKPALNNSNTKSSTLKEWNSFFVINDLCNADSIFSNGRNRDEVFVSNIQKYLDKNWYNKLKKNLWGDCIDDQSVELNSRDPETLKNVIMYQLYYFGASDDIRNMGHKKYKSRSDITDMRWHIGLGGLYEKSNSSRKLTQELSFLSPTSDYKNLYKVVGLPPRTAYAYNLQNNINISDFVGSINPDGTTSPNGSSTSNPDNYNNY